MEANWEQTARAVFKDTIESLEFGEVWVIDWTNDYAEVSGTDARDEQHNDCYSVNVQVRAAVPGYEDAAILFQDGGDCNAVGYEDRFGLATDADVSELDCLFWAVCVALGLEKELDDEDEVRDAIKTRIGALDSADEEAQRLTLVRGFLDELEDAMTAKASEMADELEEGWLTQRKALNAELAAEENEDDEVEEDAEA